MLTKARSQPRLLPPKSSKAVALRLAMNEWGAQNMPFLFALDYDLQQPLAWPLEFISPSWLRYSFRGVTNVPFAVADDLPSNFNFTAYPIDFQYYKQAFDIIRKHLLMGDTYLLNLTFPTPVQSNLSLEHIFQLAQAPYKMWLKDQFTFFSPESFVSIKDGVIASFPMKGTISAALPDAESLLLNNAKEKAEHATIVDLIRNDLSRVATAVRVVKYRYIESVVAHTGPLLQSSSHIQGRLPGDYCSRIGDILFSLLPAGSISGAPKPATLDIIRKAEGYRRGYYTGVCGIFNEGNLDSAVMIRFIEQTPGGLVFKSGGGITAFSNAEDEYKELLQKIYLPVRQPKPV